MGTQKFLLIFIIFLCSCKNEESQSSNQIEIIEKKQIKSETMLNEHCYANLNENTYSLNQIPDELLIEEESFETIINSLSENCYDEFFEIIKRRIDNHDLVAFQVLHNMIKYRNLEYFSDYILDCFLNNNNFFLDFLERYNDTLIQESLEEGIGFHFFNNEYIGEGEDYPEFENKIILINTSFEKVPKQYILKSANNEYTVMNLETYINDLINKETLSIRKKTLLKILLKRIEFARYINS